MKSLLILAVVTVLAISLGANHANAMCAIDTDWPDKPCIDTSPPLPLSKSEWRDLWSEYYTFKGADWMEQQKLELDKQTKSDNLKEWIESGYDSQNFTNYNVWFYYYANDQAPAPEGYELDETIYNKEILSPLKQFNSGIPIDEIQCKEGLELVIKSSDNTPACVKLTSVPKLIERGWTDSITHITSTDSNESSTRTINLVDNDKVISLKKGERFLLKLGDDYNWDVEINNQTIVSKVINIMIVKGTQGVYESHNLGNAVMTTTGNPICLATSTPCLQPSILLTWNIQVIE